jgi:hypothetical protein
MSKGTSTVSAPSVVATLTTHGQGVGGWTTVTVTESEPSGWVTPNAAGVAMQSVLGFAAELPQKVVWTAADAGQPVPVMVVWLPGAPAAGAGFAVP